MKVAIALSMCVATAAFAQSESRPRAIIQGTVTDTALRPIVGADVAIAGSAVHIATDSLGRFRIINVPVGRFVLMARSIGRAPAADLVEVGANDTLNLSFTLEQNAQLLSTVVVTERSVSRQMADFERRRKSGFGRIFTYDDFEKKGAYTVVDALRTVASVRLNPTRSGGWVALSTRGPTPCALQVFLDGMAMSGVGGRVGSGPFDLSFLPSTSQILAIEVYATANEVPPHLAPGLGGWGACGAIFVWTSLG